MSGTKSGGEHAAITNKKRHGEDFYSRIGRKGGSKSRPETRVFHVDRQLAREAGRIGGLKSSRLGVKNAKNKAKSQDNAQETQE